MPSVERRAGIEAVPTEPENEHAHRDQRHAVPADRIGRAILIESSETWTEHPSSDEGRDAAHRVDDRGAGEVVKTEARQPAATPDPVADDGVDESRDEEGVGQVRNEFGALGHGTGNDRRHRPRENSLK
jgi:hypothetical protein